MLTAISLATVLSLTACSAGPDYVRPDIPQAEHYLADSTTGNSDAATAAIAPAPQVEREWWKQLGSGELDALIQQAFANNPTLQAAEASLQQAQALFDANAAGNTYPQVNAGIGAQRQRFNPVVLGQSNSSQVFNLYSATVDMRYNFDLSGGNQRALEALAAQSDYRQYQLQAAQLTLAANIVSNAISQASLKAQIETVEAVVTAQQQQVSLAQKRLRLGQGSRQQMLSLQTREQQTRASLPELRNNLQQLQHQLAVLTGQTPANASLPDFRLQDFQLPRSLPLIVPSQLLRARPDILASESLLQAANAEYAVAVSRSYPQLALSASLGTQALTTGALFGGSATVWSLLGQLTQPLFDPGLSDEKRAALAAFDAATANYRNVVLESFRSVADVLRALENDADKLSALSEATASSEEVLNITRNRYRLGAASYVELLDAREQYQTIRRSLIDAQARQLIDSVAFYQAMGGGIIDNGQDAAVNGQNNAHISRQIPVAETALAQH